MPTDGQEGYKYKKPNIYPLKQLWTQDNQKSATATTAHAHIHTMWSVCTLDLKCSRKSNLWKKSIGCFLLYYYWIVQSFLQFTQIKLYCIVSHSLGHHQIEWKKMRKQQQRHWATEGEREREKEKERKRVANAMGECGVVIFVPLMHTLIHKHNVFNDWIKSRIIRTANLIKIVALRCNISIRQLLLGLCYKRANEMETLAHTHTRFIKSWPLRVRVDWIRKNLGKLHDGSEAEDDKKCKMHCSRK